MDISRPPAPWSIEMNGAGGDDHVRIGHRRLRLRDVASVHSGTATEMNGEGHILAVGMFMGAGALLVLPVAMQLLHHRFLAGGILFIGIGLATLSDVLNGHRIVIHRVALRLKDGRTETFSSTEAAECARLVATLRSLLDESRR